MHRYRFERDFTLIKAAALVGLIGLAGLLNAAQAGTEVTEDTGVTYRILPALFQLDGDCDKDKGVSL